MRCEAAVAEGLEPIARDELRLLGRDLSLRPPPGGRFEPGALAFDYSGDPRRLLRLRTVLSLFLVRSYALPRPRALLGDEHLRALLGQIAAVRQLHPGGAFQTLFISAAGSETAVMLRLKDELASATGLSVGLDDGDLLLRLRRTPGAATGWDVLVRMTPRPLATRFWRVCNLEGALNATVGHAMALLTRPADDDIFLNLACGSGTLLVERLACGPSRRAIGCDTSAAALDCARQNLAAAGRAAAAELYSWDARALPLPAGSITALCADLPFGHLSGSHAENLALYPAVLAEAARVAQPGAPFVLITHEIRLMEQLLAGSEAWAADDVLRVALGGLHPRIYVLRRLP